MARVNKEIQIAVIVAANVESDFDLDVFAHLADPRVERFVMRWYRIWRYKNSNKKGRFDEAIETLEGFDGSFLSGFLEFLIENKEEIMELIMFIIGLFGAMKVKSFGDNYGTRVLEAVEVILRAKDTSPPVWIFGAITA